MRAESSMPPWECESSSAQCSGQANVAAVHRSCLPKALKYGVAGKLAALSRDDGTFDTPPTVHWLNLQRYRNGHGRTRHLTSRTIRFQLRQCEAIGLLILGRETHGRHQRRRIVRIDRTVLLDKLTILTLLSSWWARRENRKGWANKPERLVAKTGKVVTDVDLTKNKYVDRIRDLGNFPEQADPYNLRAAAAHKRAPAAPDIAEPGGWGYKCADREAMEVALATVPIHEQFASAAQTRFFGYRVFDADPRQFLDEHV